MPKPKAKRRRKRKTPILRFDREQAVKLCRSVIHSWQTRTNGFQGMDCPEALLPDDIIPGSREHACFTFFFGWTNVYGQSAFNLARKCAEIHRDNRWVIDPSLELPSDADMEEAISPAVPFVWVNPERAVWWETCRTIVRDEYGSDPRNIFLFHGSSRDEFLRTFRRFPGIGPKIAQLLGLWFQDIAWGDDYLDLFRRPRWEEFQRVPLVPVDMWVMRLMFQCRVITRHQTDSHSRISRPISDYLCKLCADYELSHSDLSQGLWHIGSEICFKRPKRSRRPQDADAHCLLACPVHDFCQYTIHEPGKAYQDKGTIGADHMQPRRSLFTPRQK